MVSRCSHVSGAGSSTQPSATRRPNPALVLTSRSSSVPPAHSGYTRQGCAGTTRCSSLAAATGWRAAWTDPAAPPPSALPWPRRRSHAHPVRRRARHLARYRDHRRAQLARLASQISSIDEIWPRGAGSAEL
eukprot:scaffold27886_cov59-Phaeocystis_antarctica.AAC.4